MGYDKSVYKTFALITQLGLSMLTPILLCVFLGSFLEKRYSWPVCIPLLIMGILAGFRNTYLLAKDANKAQGDKEKE